MSQTYRCEKITEWTCPTCRGTGLVPEYGKPDSMIACPDCDGRFYHKVAHLLAEASYTSDPIRVTSDRNGSFGKVEFQAGKRYTLTADG